jgi:hypothetical protein
VPQDYLLAHVWYNLAASSLSPHTAAEEEARTNILKMRDAVAAKMSPNQTAAAQSLAGEWLQRHQSAESR